MAKVGLKTVGAVAGALLGGAVAVKLIGVVAKKFGVEDEDMFEPNVDEIENEDDEEEDDEADEAEKTEEDNIKIDDSFDDEENEKDDKEKEEN